jgi:xeroderma pigmentosum group C-complementing protein
MESCMEREDFRYAAEKLKGSRDVGAQLFCALLRSAGVETRLVCSLQPLQYTAGGPTLPKSRKAETPSKGDKIRSSMEKYDRPESPTTSTARRRLGHPNAAAYNIPSVPQPTSKATSARNTPKQIRESSFPVYWVEVLDVAHQKWQPVDALVTGTMWKPRLLEPPAADRENNMSYVVAFRADGTAKDVTRRYVKAYTAKTLRTRIETAVERGDRWWRKALRPFVDPNRWVSDLDQIEENELTAAVAREPMPRNVADFKDHPIYALERHLRRHDVLPLNAHEVGTISAGSRAPLERIYRRGDVKIARTREKWYRLGRVVKPYEIAPKWLPKRASTNDEDDKGEVGTPIFTLDQTETFIPPPVKDGEVPKNKFGNIDLYVPSMIPEGGFYIADERAARAAFLLGVDYAPALTGFHFKGKRGTAVFQGVVVPTEAAEAVQAVAEGLRDMELEMAEKSKTRKLLHNWKKFLVGLRIRDRVGAGLGDEESLTVETEELENDEFLDMEYGGGGFVVD